MRLSGAYNLGEKGNLGSIYRSEGALAAIEPALALLISGCIPQTSIASEGGSAQVHIC